MPAHHAVHYHAAIASYPPQPRRHCQLPATPSPPLPAARRSLTMASLRTLAPAMPPAIKAMLHEKYEEIDPAQSITPLLDFIKEAEVFHEFAHARDPFVVHLRRTWVMLAAWGQAEETCRCGLFHSAYARDGAAPRSLLFARRSLDRSVRCCAGLLTC